MKWGRERCRKARCPGCWGTGKNGEGGEGGRQSWGTRRGETNAGSAGPGGLLGAGGHGKVTIRRWEEADRAARKQIRGWLSPCSLCFPAKSHAPSCGCSPPASTTPSTAGRLLPPASPGGGIPHCAASPLALSRALGGRRTKAELVMNARRRVCPSLPSPKGFAVCVGLGRISAPRSPKVVLGAQSLVWG